MKNAFFSGKFQTNPTQRIWSRTPFEREQVLRKAIIFTIVPLFLILTIDGIFSKTDLITSVNGTYLHIMWAICLIIYWPIVALVIIREKKGSATRKLAILALGMIWPFAGIMLGGDLARRTSDWWEFPFNSGAIEAHYYPILDVNRNYRAGTQYVAIDPYKTGHTTHLYVSNKQYRSGALKNWQSGDVCVAVLQQQSKSGAVQIITQALTSFFPQTLIIMPCHAPKMAVSS
jgi:hypothetical protein